MGVDSESLSSNVAALHATLRALDKAVRISVACAAPADRHSSPTAAAGPESPARPPALSPQSAAAWRRQSFSANETARTALQAAAGERIASAALEQRLQAAEARCAAVTQQRDNALRALEDAAAAIVLAQTERSKAESVAESLRLQLDAAPRLVARPTSQAATGTADELDAREVAALQQAAETERVRSQRLGRLLQAALNELADFREAEASMRQLRNQADALVPAAAEAMERWATRQVHVADAAALPPAADSPLPRTRDDAPAARASSASDGVALEMGDGVDSPLPAAEGASPAERRPKAAVSQSPLRSALSRRHPLAI
jgi:hypothetical protein